MKNDAAYFLLLTIAYNTHFAIIISNKIGLVDLRGKKLCSWPIFHLEITQKSLLICIFLIIISNMHYAMNEMLNKFLSSLNKNETESSMEKVFLFCHKLKKQQGSQVLD